MIKVLFINHVSSEMGGGAERVLYDILSNIDKNRITPVLLCPKIPDGSDFNNIKNSITCYEIDFGKLTFKSKLKGIFAIFLKLIILSQKICKIIKKENINLIYANSLISGFFSLLPSLILNKNLIYHEHGLPILRRGSLWHKCFPLITKKSSKIIAISGAVKQALQNEGVDGKKIEIIYNGIILANSNTHKKIDFKKQFNISPEEKVVGKVAHFLPWKGHMTFLKSIPLVLRDFSNVKFIIVGGGRAGDEPYYKKLQSYVKEADIEKSVVFTGYRNDAIEIMKEFEILVHASEAEPFGLIFLEAMMLGKPIIATNAGAAPEIIIEKENGLLFQPGNHLMLAQCILRLLKDPEKCLQMGIKGRELAQKKFTLRAQVEKIQALLEKESIN